MHADTLYKHNCACDKLPFGVCRAHNTVFQMRTYHTHSRAFKSCLILNVLQLDQNPGYIPVKE